MDQATPSLTGLPVREGDTYRALAARVGTEVPAYMLNPTETTAGVSNNRHRLVMAHDVLLREKERSTVSPRYVPRCA